MRFCRRSGALGEGVGPSVLQNPSFLQTAGLPQITFLSGSGFESGLSLESKVFSIYADGYVRQGKRETHVRITAVVDFRKAPSVTDMVARALDSSQSADQKNLSQAQKADAEKEDGEGGTPVGISGALVPSTAGRVIYYRVN